MDVEDGGYFDDAGFEFLDGVLHVLEIVCEVGDGEDEWVRDVGGDGWGEIGEAWDGGYWDFVVDDVAVHPHEPVADPSRFVDLDF